MLRKDRSAPKRQSFLQGALWLAAGILLVKVIGALFKVPLSAVITEEGMGYFSTAYSFYNVIFSMATAGFPVAVSRMVSESDSLGHWREVRRIRSAALPVFLLAGLLGTVLMIVFAPLYTRAVQNSGALPAMLMLAPSVLLCSAAAAFRGYFEGLRDMTPTAVSQVIEAAAKLLFGLSAAYLVMRAGERSLMENRVLSGLSERMGLSANQTL
ncbi:MAG: oligosaccharide flippase family protein, partial [Clostridia bacterium]|nr:oligosaccharide flippase family protein [Clostridia bacterium]